MSPTAAGLTATLISFVLFICAGAWVAAPWMRRQPAALALSLPLWIHAFRHVALQVFSAQHFGFAVSGGLASEIAWGDVAGGILALAGLWLLRHRPRAAPFVIWVFVVETVVDLINATAGGIREGALQNAHDLTWVILTFYVPLLWVSLGLLVWQLLTRRGQLTEGVAAQERAGRQA